MDKTQQEMIDKDLLNKAIMLFEKLEGRQPSEIEAINYILSIVSFQEKEIEKMAVAVQAIRQPFPAIARRSIRQGIEYERRILTRGTGARLLERLTKLYEYNQHQTDIRKKIEINAGLFRTGLAHAEFYNAPELVKKLNIAPTTIAEFIAKYQEEINNHHKEQGIEPGHNHRMARSLRKAQELDRDKT